MATYGNPGDSIECKQSQIAVRKCFTNNPVRIKFNNGKLTLWKYKSSIRSTATIITQLAIVEPNTDVKPIISDDSKVETGDMLNCETMEIYTEDRLPSPMPLVSNFSHVHGIQGHRMNCFTYAKVVTPWRFVLEQIETSKALPKAS